MPPACLVCIILMKIKIMFICPPVTRHFGQTDKQEEPCITKEACHFMQTHTD